MKYVSFTLIFIACLANLSQAQKITYSSTQKSQNVRLVVKYPTLTQKSETKDLEKVAFVQTPMISNKKQIYGALVEKSRL
ncbi:hypothetical protein EGI26_10975 [Lacihabitans sp. CCS-44]|nr:hypothetical protein [Lacihabitans sp. CCS-44]